MRQPSLEDRVHWHTGVGAGLFGRIVMLHSIPEKHGTMAVEWDDGQISKHLPQRLLSGDARWSYGPALAIAA